MRPLILVVDDTALARTTLRKILEPRGFTVVEADSTAEAIRVYREAWPDVVTMDMLMDHHNGIVAIQALKHIDHDVKIVVCSATSNQSFVMGAATLGIKEYLNKPIEAERLIAAIERLMAAKKPDSPA